MKVKEYGYEYDAELNKELFDEVSNLSTYSTFDGAICLRSGRDAIKTVAREYPKSVVILPSLACDSMVLPFESYGYDIKYYRFNEDITIDINHLKSLIDNYKNQTIIFLYMDYFGIRSISDDELAAIKDNYKNVVFVEDITHVLLNQKIRSFKADYVVASFRKWLNIPDGGLLWANKELKNSIFSEDITFSHKRLKAQIQRNEYLKTGNESLKNEFRKTFSTVTDIIDGEMIPSRMTEYSYRIIKNSNLEEIKEIRKDNSKALISILSKCSKIRILQSESGVSDLYVPFVVDDRTFKQSKLSQLGIFNTIIWPLNDKQKEVCPVSKYVEEHMLAAPCDQRYSVEDMSYIGNEIVRIFNE